MAGRALAAALKISLMWTKHSQKKSEAGSYNDSVELEPKDIPDNVEIDCKMDIALPQDRLGNVNVAKMATDPNNPLASVAWAQTNILGIDQPDQMMKEILTERAALAMFQQYMQQMMQQAQMQQQQAMQGQQMQGPPQAQMQPGMEGAQGIPPEMMANGMQGPQPMPGEQQQLPPEMAGGPGAPLNQ
jgi:hypothetical protein